VDVKWLGLKKSDLEELSQVIPKEAFVPLDSGQIEKLNDLFHSDLRV